MFTSAFYAHCILDDPAPIVLSLESEINPYSSVFVLLDPVHFCLEGEKC